MDEFFSKNLPLITKLKQIFLWSASIMLIGDIAVGMILILTGNFSALSAKLLGTLSLFALGLFIGVNNFSRIIKGSKAVQVLACLSLATNIIWMLLGVLLIWEVVPLLWYEEVTNDRGFVYSYSVSHITVIGKIFWTIVGTAIAGFVSSNMLMIKNSNAVIRPLKVTALSSLGISWLSAVVIIFTEGQSANSTLLSQLYSLSGAATVILWIAIAIIAKASNSEKKPYVKAENELRSEIEAQIRREMAEKAKESEAITTAPAPAVPVAPTIPTPPVTPASPAQTHVSFGTATPETDTNPHPNTNQLN